MKQKNYSVLLLAAGILGGSLLSSCTDNDFDLSKDIDLTMGLGSNGLALKIGNTEKIYLKDILETSDVVDTLPASQGGLYYLIKEGNSQTNVSINEITQNGNILDTELGANVNLEFPAGVPIPAGETEPFEAGNEEKVNVTIEDIPEEIVSLRKIQPEQPIDMGLTLKIDQPAHSHFALKRIDRLTISFPSYIYSQQFREGTHDIVVENMECQTNAQGEVQITAFADSIVLGQNTPFGLKREADGSIHMPADEVEPIRMQGTFVLENDREVTLQEGDEIQIKLLFKVNAINRGEVTGLVNPEVEPDIDPLEISNDLPEFLKDPDVKLEMSNPTLRFDIAGTTLPIPLLFRAELDSRNYTTGGQSESILPQPIQIPAAGTSAAIPAKQNSSHYFYQGASPFDPELNPNAKKYEVSNLSTLIEKLPDFIQPDLSGGKIHSDQTRLHKLTIPQDVEVGFDYKVLVPFHFNASTQIVYNDSIEDMNEDLEDFQADSLFVTGTAHNGIPLALTLTLEPCGVRNSQGIREDLSHLISVSTVELQPAGGIDPDRDFTETQFRVALKLKDRKALQLLDAFNLKVRAASTSTTSQSLTSLQYLRLKDLRIRLGGQIIGDFNDDED